MSDKKPRFTQRFMEKVISDIDSRLYQVYARAKSHVAFDITEAGAFEALVRDEDKDVVRRSGELYGFVMNHYYGSTRLEVNNIIGFRYALEINFNKSMSWLPPRYLRGKISADKLPDEFLPTFISYIEQAAPLRDMYTQAMRAWSNLRTLCDNDLSRMRYIWPSVEVLANLHGDGVDFSRLAKPKGVPSPSPELREDLTAATAFINMVLLMPPLRDERSFISLDLT